MGLWVVRHAKPMIASGTCYGQLDVPADAECTLKAAHDVVRALAEVAHSGIHIRYSPLQRCEQLALHICALRPDVVSDCVADERLMEMNFGVFEGRRWDSIGVAPMQAWTNDFADHRFGGAESLRQFMARVGDAWDGYMARSATDPELHEVWISHAGVARAVSLLSRGVRCVENAVDWPLDAPDFGKWEELPTPQWGAGVLAR
jgi:alpha-ribazole phosphatase